MYTCMRGKAISELSLSETESMVVELRHSKRTDETQSDPHEGDERGNTLQSSKVFCFVVLFCLGVFVFSSQGSSPGCPLTLSL